MKEKTSPWKAYGGIMLAAGTVFMIVAIALFADDPHSTIYGIKKLYWAIGVGIAALMDIAVGLAFILSAKIQKPNPPTNLVRNSNETQSHPHPLGDCPYQKILTSVTVPTISADRLHPKQENSACGEYSSPI